MDIKGLDYNTQREHLAMPEYGREIQKMVDWAVGLPTKEERTVCAQTIVRLMETKMPQLRGNADYEQTLWDHLYLMSDKQLDIDWPFDVSEAEKIHTKPEPLPLPQKPPRATAIRAMFSCVSSSGLGCIHDWKRCAHVGTRPICIWLPKK